MTLAGDFVSARQLSAPDKDELFAAIRDDELPDYMRTVFNRADGRLPGEGPQALRFFHRGQDDASWGLSSSLVGALTGPVTEASVAEAEGTRA